MPEENGIKLERIIKAPIEEVFQYLVESDKLERWFYTECIFDVDARTFSAWFVSKHRDELDMRCYGTILRIEPNDRLVLEWNDGVFETSVEFTLKSITNRTTYLSMVHYNWTESAYLARAKQKNQWDFYLDNLRRVLQGQGDLRESFFAQVVKNYSANLIDKI